MKLSVKNFGPIGDAKDIRVSPMTMFVGPSNTGKSYLAVLLYTILNVLEDFRPLMNIQRLARQELKNNPEVQERIDRGVSAREATKESVEAWCASHFIYWAEGIARLWHKQILYCFGEEGENLIQDNMSAVICSDDGKVVVDLISPRRSKMDSHALSEAVDKLIRSWSEMPLEAEFQFPFSAPIDIDEMVRMFRSALWGDAPAIAHYLPAIRGGIMQSHRGLVDATMAQAPFVGLGGDAFRRMNSMPMFTGVISDFMRKLIDLPGRKHRMPFRLRRTRRVPRDIVAIGEDMESGIMDGEIKVDKSETGYPDFRYKFSRGGKERELQLSNTSSMVSELAPVSLFIRHHLGKGDLFIVEEPEAHLHPDGQRAISDILVQLANAGVFVLATTHSDIVLEQISNAVRQTRQKGKKPGAKNGVVALDEDKVSVYSFGSVVKGKTKVEKINFDSEDGLMTDDHLRSSTVLYNDTVGLMDGEGQ